MATIKPFRGLRPKRELAERVASLPYDVMNTEEARIMASDNPHSFLHVSRAEIDLPRSIDIHSPEVYIKAKENFLQLIQSGVLFQDSNPCYYIYAQKMNNRKQYGLAVCSSIDDYFSDIIKKHEFTRPEKELDRIQHMEAVQAHVGPVFLTYPAHPRIKEIVSSVCKQQPEYDFTSEDNINHQLWIINNIQLVEEITNLFAQEIPFTYIADGHHRAASAAKVGEKMRAIHSEKSLESNFFLSVLFPADELEIMDYNRLIKDLNGYSQAELLEKIGLHFTITAIDEEFAKPTTPKHFGMYMNHQWYLLKAKEHIFKDDPIGVLDVSMLQDNILNPLLGIADPRTDKRIDFVGGIRGIKDLQKRVDSGEHQVAFALYPVSLDQLIAIANSGNVMPPKSTWFEPKLRDGLLCHLFN